MALKGTLELILGISLLNSNCFGEERKTNSSNENTKGQAVQIIDEKRDYYTRFFIESENIPIGAIDIFSVRGKISNRVELEEQLQRVVGYGGIVESLTTPKNEVGEFTNFKISKVNYFILKTPPKNKQYSETKYLNALTDSDKEAIDDFLEVSDYSRGDSLGIFKPSRDKKKIIEDEKLKEELKQYVGKRGIVDISPGVSSKEEGMFIVYEIFKK